MLSHLLARAARGRRGAIMIIALLIVIVLLGLGVALLRLTGAGADDAARTVDVNQSQTAANVAVQQAIAWMNQADLTPAGYGSLEAALDARSAESPSAERTADLGRSCYEWSLSDYDADAGTVTITGIGLSPAARTGDECEPASPHQRYQVKATVKLAPAALGYAVAGNDIHLGQGS